MPINNPMPVYLDQMNRAVELPDTPKRIISLVPSQTELLFDLGLNEEIIGVTKFCIHPADLVKQKLKIGGTKNLNIKLINELNPDPGVPIGLFMMLSVYKSTKELFTPKHKKNKVVSRAIIRVKETPPLSW